MDIRDSKSFDEFSTAKWLFWIADNLLTAAWADFWNLFRFGFSVAESDMDDDSNSGAQFILPHFVRSLVELHVQWLGLQWRPATDGTWAGVRLVMAELIRRRPINKQIRQEQARIEERLGVRFESRRQLVRYLKQETVAAEREFQDFQTRIEAASGLKFNDGDQLCSFLRFVKLQEEKGSNVGKSD